MSLDQHSTPPAGPQNYYGASQQPQGTSGLAIAGLIFAFLAAPLGFLLSLIAVFTTGKPPKKKGRGMAIAGLIVSILIIGGATTAVVALSNSTLADPGCSAGKDAVLNGADNVDDPNSLQTTIDGLNAAAAKATHANVRDAMKALANDYTQLLNATKTGNMPAGLTDQVTKDAGTIDSLCSIGS